MKNEIESHWTKQYFGHLAAFLIVMGLAMGAIFYISKWINEKDLVAKIGKWLKSFAYSSPTHMIIYFVVSFFIIIVLAFIAIVSSENMRR